MKILPKCLLCNDKLIMPDFLRGIWIEVKCPSCGKEEISNPIPSLCDITKENKEILRTKFTQKLIADTMIQHLANYHDGLNEAHPNFGDVR